MILFHKCLWGRSLKELLSSHSFFVTSWKDPSNVGDVHITSGFRVKFRLLNFIVMVCVFSPDSFRLNITHTHRPHHPPPPTHTVTEHISGHLHEPLCNFIPSFQTHCVGYSFPSSPIFASSIILPLPQILLLCAPYLISFFSCKFCLELFGKD